MIVALDRGNSEITVETVRIINEGLSIQISRKLDKIKRRIDLPILAAITTSITKKMIPGLQESIEALENEATAKLDLQSAGLDNRNTGGTEIG